MIPLFHPPRQDVDRMVAEVKDTLLGRWWGQGPKVDKFEHEFSKKFGFEHCCMVNSGTAALHLAYILAGIEPGAWDEVVVPVLTCTATCHPLLWMGAKIVFADINETTLTLDPGDLEKRITPRTRAVVHVHLGGAVNDIQWIGDICKKAGVKIIEDACQALGARTVGYGDYTCFSFQAIKSMSTGDGGMLCCKNEEDLKRAKKLRWFAIDREQKAKKGWQAWDRRGITFDQEEPGYKYQPTDIDAALGLAALHDFDRNLIERHIFAHMYRKGLAGVGGLYIPLCDDTADWLFMVLVFHDRDGFAEKLLASGIETNVAHIRNDIFTVFGGKREKLRGMNNVEKQYLCLPLNNWITEGDVEKVIDVAKKAVK